MAARHNAIESSVYLGGKIRVGILRRPAGFS
jgi:hypothetical protein